MKNKTIDIFRKMVEEINVYSKYTKISARIESDNFLLIHTPDSKICFNVDGEIIIEGWGMEGKLSPA